MSSFVNLLSLTVLFCLLVPILRQLQCLHHNYQAAKRTGLHVVVVPVDPYGTFWQISSQLCAPLLRHFEWCRILSATWTWEDGSKRHDKYGETFIVASPARNIVFTSDKVAVEEALKKIKSWVKPKLYENMDFYGKNVDTVNGEDWSRHRKITAPCFNERVSGFVWEETVRQAQAMLDHWLAQPGGNVSRMVDDTRIIALHVLYAAGFGVQHDFHGGVRKPAPGHQLSHRDALMTILNNLITIIIIAPQEAFLTKIPSLCTARIRKCLLALHEFRQYTNEAIASERALLSQGLAAHKPNLISTLIRTSDAAKAEGIHAMAQLSDDEIKGNIFIFNLAGHDTTANTLAYAFALLAIHPEVQAWVVEEIDEVLGEGEGEGRYEEAHPRLKRVLAVMYETLRLYGPVPQIPRTPSTPHLTLPLSHPPHTITFPPSTDLTLDIHAMHTSASNFPDPDTWRPSRWITTPSSSGSGSLSDEKLLLPEQSGAAFAAWAGGPRVCPGMKFSQVEFVGVVSRVLRGGRVVPVLKGGEKEGKDEEEARRVLTALVRDSWQVGATISMRRPEEVWVGVRRR